MRIIDNIEDLITFRGEITPDKTVGFVPTMGALHKGHLSLLDEASSKSDIIIASIYVNPTQFAPGEDLEEYPRTLPQDIAQLEAIGCDALFVPTNRIMYPDGFQTFVYNNEISKILCGRTRATHFEGVLTSVLKLFNLVRPEIAVFGKKDFQQVKVIEKMCRDLHLTVEVLSAPIFRESDGLAMSSRNLRLTKNDRELAPRIYRGLKLANDVYKQGERNIKSIKEAFHEAVLNTPLSLEYLEIRRASDLSEAVSGEESPWVMLTAAKLGDVRLIDNIELGYKH